MDNQDLSITDVKKRAVSAFFSLTARQVLLRAMGFVTINVILASILPVETLGIFNIAQSVITFFAYFSDVGLAASLIQKKDKITEHDIRTTFTIQQGLVFLLSLVVVVFAPQIATFYALDESGMWLIRVLAFSFFLTSFKVVPSVLLERDLNFRPLVTVEIAENLLFNVALIILTFSGFGLWAFSIAALLRSIVGVILIFVYAPVPIRIGLEKSAAKGLLKFGVPFQLNSLLALLKDRLVPLVIAKMIGATGMGYVTWSQGLAYISLEIMQVIIRITFPAFSRLQHDKDSLAVAANRSLFVTTLFVYPALFGMGAILPTLVYEVINPKWAPAIPSFYLFAVSTYWAVISTTLTNLLNAMGHIKTTLKLMVMWTVLTWLLTPILVSQYGFIGVGLAAFVISFSSILTVVFAKRLLSIKVFDAIFIPTICSLVMGIVVFIFCQLLVTNWMTLILAIGVGFIIYGACLYLIAKERILSDLKNLKGSAS
jgi:O-antigen/teichoic acid export membrane protein